MPTCSDRLTGQKHLLDLTMLVDDLEEPTSRAPSTLMRMTMEDDP